MVQTVKTIVLSPGDVAVFFESVNILKRCFFGIYTVNLSAPYLGFILISLGDDSFTNVFTLSYYKLFFEIGGKNIYQGTILVKNTSVSNTYRVTGTEILE